MLKQWIIGAALAAAVAFPGTAASGQITSAQRVLVIPFTTLNVPEGQQWIARGVQENIVADFGRAGGWSPVAFQGQVIVEDNATAARLGRQASADYAIRGSAQLVGTTVRLTAQLIDARSGDTLSTASVTGSPNDLLRLEDELSSQLRLGPSTAAAGAGVATVPAAAQQPAEPQIVVVSQPSSPALGYDPNMYYDNGYPYYGYGYPSVWWPVVIPIDHGHHGHGDDCPPDRPGGGWSGWRPPEPTPVYAHPAPVQGPIVRKSGFALPIPEQPGFALPIPKSNSGFSLPIPQSNVAVQQQRLFAQPQRQWSVPARISVPQMPSPQMSAPRLSAPRMSAPVPSAPARSMSRTQFVSFR